MQKIQMLIGNLFADGNRSIEDLSAGFLAHATLFQAAPDKTKLLLKNQQHTQALAGQLRQLSTAIGSGQAQQQVGRSLTEADQQLALTRLSGTAAALAPANDYVVPEARDRARLLQLLFPQGVGAFSTAPLKTLPDLLRTYLDLVQNPESRVPQVITDKSVADLTPFATSRDTQLTQMQATNRARTQRQALLPQLEEQLTRNLHALCLLFEDDRSQAASYFDARYFEAQATSRPGRHAGTVAAHHANQVMSLADAPARYTRLALSVTEERPLTFFRASDTKALPPGNALVVTHSLPRTLALTDIPGLGTLLVVCNDGAYVGHYVAELLGPEVA